MTVGGDGSPVGANKVVQLRSVLGKQLFQGEVCAVSHVLSVVVCPGGGVAQIPILTGGEDHGHLLTQITEGGHNDVQGDVHAVGLVDVLCESFLHHGHIGLGSAAHVPSDGVGFAGISSCIVSSSIIGGSSVVSSCIVSSGIVSCIICSAAGREGEQHAESQEKTDEFLHANVPPYIICF